MQKIDVKSRILIVSLLLISLISALAMEVFATESTAGAYDYARPGDEAKTEVFAAMLMDEYLTELGDTLSEKERSFIERFSTISYSYTSTIMSNNIKIEFADELFTVEAKDYSYTGENGKVLTWSASEVKIGDSQISLSPTASGTKKGSIKALQMPKECTVTYEAQITITKNDINTLINLYYDTAKYINDKELYDEYLTAKRLYDDALEKYNKYLIELEEYEEDLLLIENYESALEKYNNDYKLYQEYETKLASYNKALASYNDYIGKLSTVKRHLEGLNLVNTLKIEDRTLFIAINGGSSDLILNNETVLIEELNVEKQIVDTIRDSTNYLRSAMATFNSLKTEAEKYNFYISNYDKICSSVLGLLQSMDKLFDYQAVQIYVADPVRYKKYIIFMVQSAILANVLIDQEVLYDADGKIAYDKKWTIDGYRISDLYKEPYIDNNDAKPLEKGYPTAVAKPEAPEVVNKPTMPIRPTVNPTKPQAADAPGDAPTEVKQPSSNSGLTSIVQRLSSDEREALKAAYLGGEITKRAPVSEDRIYKLKTYVIKRSVDPINVTFYDKNGEVLETHEQIDPNTPVIYTGTPLHSYKETDAVYIFAGWKDSRGDIVDISSGFNKNTSLTPYYKKHYEVTWVINGNSKTELLVAGSVPVCSDTPERPDDIDAYYTFAGWEGYSTLPPLAANSTYTAKFNKTYIVPLSGDTGAVISKEGERIICDAGGSTGFNIAMLLDKARAEKCALDIKTDYGTISFSFTDVMAMDNAGVAVFNISVIVNSLGKYFYKIDLLDKNGNISDVGVEPLAVFAKIPQIFDNTVLFTQTDGEYTYIKATYNENGLSFKITPSCMYKLDRKYQITVNPNTLVDITIDKKEFLEGDVPALTIIPGDGVEYTVKITDKDGNVLVDENGNPIAPSENGKLYGLSGDAIITVNAQKRTYIITFKANGKIIAEYEVEHGSEVVPPVPPVVPSDTYYSYSFSTWNKDVTVATGDAVYIAQYSMTSLKSDTDKDAVKMSPEVRAVLIAVKAVIALLSAAVISVSALVVYKVVKRQKTANISGERTKKSKTKH